MQKLLPKIFLIFVVLTVFGSALSFSKEIINFGPRETRIDGSIPYSLIGQYEAQFKHFKGRIVLDDQAQNVQSVYLEIEARSITSNCSFCDKVVGSPRLLYIKKYPKIIFKSNAIFHDQHGYKVRGVLEMRGVKKEMTFPFKFSRREDGLNGPLIDLQGSWMINRKDFHIIWNKVLDKGGILVGDYLTVDWGIKAHVDPKIKDSR